MSEGGRLVCVLTTIQPPTASVDALGKTLERNGADLIVVGDRKGPSTWAAGPGRLFDIGEQLKLGFRLAPELPENHYVRKNLGYLLAIQGGAERIYETDDDNMPLDTWVLRDLVVSADTPSPRPWANVYHYFSPGSTLWPRGFPLSLANDSAAGMIGEDMSTTQEKAPIQQGLADGSPDVDAIWRLLYDETHEFGRRESSIRLQEGTWCPFNSQSTWWWPAAYPLMYLPTFCTFRMTDIWRSLIAQRCLWAMGYRLVFHSAEVFQERNPHDYLRDFKDEVPGYLENDRIRTVLEDLALEPGQGAAGPNLLRCYQTMVEAGFFPQDELRLVEAWLGDLGVLGVVSG